jgi:hypothetical protein
MKVTIKTSEGNLVTLSVDKSFQVFVDDEMLLEHRGPTPPEKVVKNSTYGSLRGTSSLFNDDFEDKEYGYLNYMVENSSFIRAIRWWEHEETLGTNALEVMFRDDEHIAYENVPRNVVEAWIHEVRRGGSAGKFYNNHIKGQFKQFFIGDEE